jgi:phytoene dehydrogenase-like protein
VTTQTYDAIIIGGGHNGLVTAAYLARAGLSVLVLERRHVLGGAACSEELYPGFRFSVCSYVVSLLRPEIIRQLDLCRHGLEIIPLPASFTPALDGRYLLRTDDAYESYREISKFSKMDAELYPEFGRMMTKLARFVRPILSMTPPRPDTLNPAELMKLLRLGARFRGLGSELMYDKLKLFTMSAVDFLEEWFEAEILKATMSVSGIIGTFLGVRSPGTAYVLLHHYMGEIDGVMRSWGFAKGGTGGVSNAIASAARANGARIRTEAPIERILTRGGRATGVVLEGGEEIQARMVVSSLDPHRTFLRLLPPDELPKEFVSGIRAFKMRGSSGKVNLAVDRLPDFSCLPGEGKHLRGDIAIAPSLDYLERAYDEAKYGQFSRRPYINMVIPSLVDPSVAPPGKHVVSCFVQYAPYQLSDGRSWDDEREAFGDTVVDTLEEYMPGFKNSILFRQVLTPLDLEREFGLTEGNIFHGELSLDQLFFLRPHVDAAQYRAPIRNLYLCGSGTHPGGGIMGAPGYIAAREILNDWKLQPCTT